MYRLYLFILLLHYTFAHITVVFDNEGTANLEVPVDKGNYNKLNIQNDTYNVTYIQHNIANVVMPYVSSISNFDIDNDYESNIKWKDFSDVLAYTFTPEYTSNGKRFGLYANTKKGYEKIIVLSTRNGFLKNIHIKFRDDVYDNIFEKELFWIKLSEELKNAFSYKVYYDNNIVHISEIYIDANNHLYLVMKDKIKKHQTIKLNNTIVQNTITWDLAEYTPRKTIRMPRVQPESVALKVIQCPTEKYLLASLSKETNQLLCNGNLNETDVLLFAKKEAMYMGIDTFSIAKRNDGYVIFLDVLFDQWKYRINKYSYDFYYFDDKYDEVFTKRDNKVLKDEPETSLQLGWNSRSITDNELDVKFKYRNEGIQFDIDYNLEMNKITKEIDSYINKLQNKYGISYLDWLLLSENIGLVTGIASAMESETCFYNYTVQSTSLDYKTYEEAVAYICSEFADTFDDYDSICIDGEIPYPSKFASVKQLLDEPYKSYMNYFPSFINKNKMPVPLDIKLNYEGKKIKTTNEDFITTFFNKLGISDFFKAFNINLNVDSDNKKNINVKNELLKSIEAHSYALGITETDAYECLNYYFDNPCKLDRLRVSWTNAFYDQQQCSDVLSECTQLTNDLEATCDKLEDIPCWLSTYNTDCCICGGGLWKE